MIEAIFSQGYAPAFVYVFCFLACILLFVFFLLLLVLQYAVYELATVRKWLLLSYFAEIFHVFYGFLYTVF